MFWSTPRNRRPTRCGLLGLFVVIIGCQDSSTPAGGPITPDDAVQIAVSACQGRVTLHNPKSARVSRDGAAYIVAFPSRLAPGTRGPDYDAKVRIDANSGQVLEVLGGG